MVRRGSGCVEKRWRREDLRLVELLLLKKVAGLEMEGRRVREIEDYL